MAGPRSIRTDEVAELIGGGDQVQLEGSFGEPRALSEGLIGGRARFARLPVWTTQIQPASPFAEWEPDGTLELRLLLSSGSSAAGIAGGGVRYVPCRYPDIARYLDAGLLGCDVALVQVSPPDAGGRCSLGATVGYLPAALRRAGRVIAQVNPRVPRVRGDPGIAWERIAAVVEREEALHEYAPEPLGESERAIARHVAALVPDGATIEVGYGAIPDAVLSALGGHRDLGVHSGMLSESMIELVESGAINGSKKPVDRELLVATVAIGTRRLYEWIDGNPRVALRETTAVCAPGSIGAMPHYRAVNTTLEVDLAGQANSEAAGPRLLGGYGSLVELAGGAHGAPGGLSIVALASTDARGRRSKIVPRLSSPLGATLGKLDADVVVTEHGAADLRLLDAQGRARALIGIADPHFRGELEAAAREQLEGFGGL